MPPKLPAFEDRHVAEQIQLTHAKIKTLQAKCLDLKKRLENVISEQHSAERLLETLENLPEPEEKPRDRAEREVSDFIKDANQKAKSKPDA